MAVLAVSLCATMAATANARGGGDEWVGASSTARAAAQVTKARDGAVDVATDAVQVAQAVQVEGTQAAVDAAQLAQLEEATARLNDLIATVVPVAPTATATAPTATAPTATAAPTDVPAPATPSTTPSLPTSTETTPAPDVSPVPAAVPALPPTTGKEDTATVQIRAAVTAVAKLAADVRESAEANRAAAQAAADAAAKAAADAAAQAATDAAAAAQAAAEKAAQRAAWKLSLRNFDNGKIPDSALCGVSFDGAVRLRCDAAEQLDVLNTAFKARFGVDLVVSDSYRSYAGQVDCVRVKGYLCATPGTSNHGNGIAVDFGGGIETFGTKQHAWMDANAGELEWVHPTWAEVGGTKPEAWHWEYSG